MCPICRQPAERTETRYGPRNDCCGLWSWGDKQLVDAETHAARKAAHDAFDPLWKTGTMTRTRAYRELRRALGISERSCHMAKMSKEMALKVPAAVGKMVASLKVAA
ncbi:DUF3268 family zinc-finger domain-containing protein [Mesorhizobium sp. BR1-1-13]|uniref:zinc-finger-containing protein n=1 Tax=Mesorhizobium sp. BR1-1-13 TaxID=2876656 RepID=UPI001CD0F41C|nr:DUF3268 family zinc-finger domain-containing protein [Mesorhizobium sp. BR1-1-13]